MAITRSNASNSRRGRVGDTTYYTSRGRQYSRAAVNSSNYGKDAKRTTAQQTRRVKWANLVNLYKNSQEWMKLAFENKKAGVSDYNKFMQLNIAKCTICFTKEQAASGSCVVESYQVSEGSLFPIQVQASGDVFVTNISHGGVDLATASVADFSAALVENNNFMRLGMQISFVSYQQFTDANNLPRILCTPYEVTLDANNTEPLRNYMPAFAMTAQGDYIGTGANLSAGAFVYVLSETISGKTKVSTQSLVLNNNAAIIGSYSSSEQLQAAINSYGVDADKFLESGSTAKDATPQPQGINMVTVAGNRVGNGNTYTWLGHVPFTIGISTTQNASVPTNVIALTQDSEGNTLEQEISVPGATISVSGGYINIARADFSNSPETKYDQIYGVKITMDGKTYSYGKPTEGKAWGE